MLSWPEPQAEISPLLPLLGLSLTMIAELAICSLVSGAFLPAMHAQGDW